MFCRLESLCMLDWIEAWLQQFIIATTRRNWFRGVTFCYQNVQGAKYPLRRNDQGRNILAWGQKETSGGNGLGRNDSNGKTVTCFTHYNVNLRQTLELIEEAFCKPWLATIAIAECRTYLGHGLGTELWVCFISRSTINTNKMTYAPSEDSYQPGKSPSLRCAVNGWLRTQTVFRWTAKTRQIGHKRRLILVFAGRTGYFVCFVVLRLKLEGVNNSTSSFPQLISTIRKHCYISNTDRTFW